MSQPSDPVASAPLDLYYDRTGTEVDMHNRRGDLSALGRQTLEALVAFCQRGVCKSCAATKGPNAHICQWQQFTEEDDAQALAERGECLGAVRRIAEFCAQLAAREYARCSGTSQNLAWSTGFTTMWSSHTKLAIQGATQEGIDVTDEKAPDSHGRTIHVSFNVDKFWVTDFLTLPYIIAHEYIAHGYCGVDVAGHDADWGKSFHDGWMDCVAFALANNALASTTISDPLYSIARYHSEFIRQAEIAKTMRYDDNAHDAPAEAVHWASGARALESFTLLVKHALWEADLCDPKDNARIQREALSISLALNASRLTHRQRGVWVDTINRKYSRNTDEARIEAVVQDEAAINVLATYLVGQLAVEEVATLIAKL